MTTTPNDKSNPQKSGVFVIARLADEKMELLMYIAGKPKQTKSYNPVKRITNRVR